MRADFHTRFAKLREHGQHRRSDRGFGGRIDQIDRCSYSSIRYSAFS